MREQTEVASSNISHIGYETGRLFIKFHSGGAYSYEQVPHEVYDELTHSESVGRTFHRRIKGKFHYTRLATDPFLTKPKR